MHNSQHKGVCLFGKVISDTHYQSLLKQAQYLSGL